MEGSSEDLSSSTVDLATTTPPPPPASTVDSSIDEDLEFGFKRPEMYNETFPGKVTPYDRHVFLCFKTADSWPGKVESAEHDHLPSKFASALQSRKKDIQTKNRFAVIEGNDQNKLTDGDVLIFPEMIKYKDLNQDDVESFVEDVLVKGTTWALGTPEVLKGYHVFVCCHTSRDKRCGVCGPALVEKLNKEIEIKGLENQIFVSPCSHIGGHKYAGNLIIFGPNPQGIVMGHWYGYATPDDVPTLLDQHIGKGQVVERLWRGEVCNFQEEKLQTDEPMLQENGGINHLKETNLEKNEKEPQQSSTNGDTQNGLGCCQGSNGFTCCMNEKVQLENGVAEEKPRECNNYCGKELGVLSAWTRKWEQSDILVASAVIGAVASVAMAYSFYRRFFHLMRTNFFVWLHLHQGLRNTSKQNQRGRKCLPPVSVSLSDLSLQHKDFNVRIVHAGGLVELYKDTIPASEVMKKYPGMCLVRPQVFKSPLKSLLNPEEKLLPGQKFYLVPYTTVRKLKHKHSSADKRSKQASGEKKIVETGDGCCSEDSFCCKRKMV